MTLLEVTRPAYRFGCAVQYRRAGRVLRDTVTVRAPSAVQAFGWLSMMATLRYGPDRIIDQFCEFDQFGVARPA